MNPLIDTWARVVSSAGVDVDTLVVIGAGDGNDAPSVGWRGLPARHTVLVEGDDLRCTRLARSVAGVAGLRVRHQVVAAAAGECIWHRFEPSFLSGLHPQQDMRRLFPRLHLDRSESVRTTGVVDLLSSSLPASDATPARHALLIDLSRGSAELLAAVPPDLLARFATVAVALCREDGPVSTELLDAWREGPAALVQENVDETDGSPLWRPVVFRRDEGQARENHRRHQTQVWEAELKSRDQEIERLRQALGAQTAVAPLNHELLVLGRRAEELQLAVAAAVADGERVQEARAAEQTAARERDADLRQRIERVRADLTKAQAERDAALATARDAGTKAESRAADVARLEEAIKVAAERSQRLSGKITERDAKLQRLQEQVAELETERGRLDSEREAAQAATTTGSELLAAANLALSELRRQVSGHEGELQAQQHRISELEQSYRQAESHAAEGLRHLTEARQRIEELQVQLDRTNADGEAQLSQQREQFVQNEAVLQQKLRTARRELETLRPEHERLVATLRANLDTALYERQALHEAQQAQVSELEGLRHVRNELLATSEASHQALATAQDELGQARREVAHWKSLADDARTSESALRTDLDEWSRQGLTLRVALDAANGRVLDLQGELADRQAKNAQLELRLLGLQEELHRAEGQLELVKELLLSDSGI